MPKVKTKKIVMKRFKMTKSGKLMHRVQGARHLRQNKSSSRKRRQDRAVAVLNLAYKRKITQFIRT